MVGGGCGPGQWRRHVACRLVLSMWLTESSGGGEAATLCSSYLLDNRLYRTVQSLRRGCNAMQQLSTRQQIVYNNPESTGQ